MAQIQGYLCEVCGRQKQPSDSNWYLAAERRWHSALDIFLWDDKLAAEPDMMHLCCVEHVECLVCDWMQPGSDLYRRAVTLGAEATLDPPDFRRTALKITELSVDRNLLSTEAGGGNNVMAIMDAIEVVLQTCETGSYSVGSPDLQRCDA